MPPYNHIATLPNVPDQTRETRLKGQLIVPLTTIAIIFVGSDYKALKENYSYR